MTIYSYIRPAIATNSYDWSGTRPDFDLSCNMTDVWTNIVSQDAAALDLFDAAAQLSAAFPRTYEA